MKNCLLPYNVPCLCHPHHSFQFPGMIYSAIRPSSTLGFAERLNTFVLPLWGLLPITIQRSSVLHFADSSLEPDQPHEPFCLIANCTINSQSNVQYVEGVECLCWQEGILFLPCNTARFFSLWCSGGSIGRQVNWSRGWSHGDVGLDVGLEQAINPLGASVASQLSKITSSPVIYDFINKKWQNNF